MGFYCETGSIYWELITCVLYPWKAGPGPAAVWSHGFITTCLWVTLTPVIAVRNVWEYLGISGLLLYTNETWSTKWLSWNSWKHFWLRGGVGEEEEEEWRRRSGGVGEEWRSEGAVGGPWQGLMSSAAVTVNSCCLIETLRINFSSWCVKCLVSKSQDVFKIKAMNSINQISICCDLPFSLNQQFVRSSIRLSLAGLLVESVFIWD